MVYFCQRDPRWASLKIPPSSLTVGRYGCTLTCLAMLSSYFQPTRSPEEIIPKLQFTADGRIIWASVNFENWRFKERVHNFNPSAVQQHIKDHDLAVMLEIAAGSHWVVAIKWSPIKSLIQIADPWNGSKTIMSRYHSDITGAAYFERKHY